MVLAVTSYDFSVFLHVTAVVVGFGSTFAESITFPVAMTLDKPVLARRPRDSSLDSSRLSAALGLAPVTMAEGFAAMRAAAKAAA